MLVLYVAGAPSGVGQNPLGQGVKTCLDLADNAGLQFLEIIKASADDAEKGGIKMVKGELIVSANVSESRVATLLAQYNHFRVIASTFPVNVPRMESVEFAMFSLPKDVQRGLVIVEDNTHGKWNSAFIPVDFAKDKPFDLQAKILFSKDDKAWNLIDHYLEVSVDGMNFTSNKNAATGNKRYVDADLLCQFICDLVPLGAITTILCDEEREADALAEAVELRKEIERLKNSKAAALGDLQHVIDKVDELRKSRLKMVDIINGLLKQQEWKPFGAARRREINNSIAKELLI